MFLETYRVKSSLPYTVFDAASRILPNSVITLDAVTVVAVTSTIAASAAHNVSNPSTCPAVALAPCQIEFSTDAEI